MRRASTLGVVTGVLLAACCGTAGASPAVTVKAEFVPVAGFPHTGNIAGAGAALSLSYRISGGEYAGHPPPLIGLSVSLARDTKLHTSRFPTCPRATLETSGQGAAACPRGSRAGPAGFANAALASVAAPGGRAEETMSVEPFYGPGGTLLLALAGASPVTLGGIAEGGFRALAGAGGYGPELAVGLPLIETPGTRADASIERLDVRIGTGIRRKVEAAEPGAGNLRTVYYLTVPRTGQCPRLGLRFSTTLTFAGFADIGAGPAGTPSSPGGAWPLRQTVTVNYKAPCPRESAQREPAEPPPPAPTALHGSHGLILSPPNGECVAPDELTLQVLARRHLAYRRIVAVVDGRRVRVLRGRRRQATIQLEQLPGGHFTVTVIVTTVHGRRITGSRRYLSCV